ncbi:hypothetical protein Bbelb_376060 [Branchiostoma belcheri]|nr:hypothetical protein Bbelb_376060 [Branchiostoma belcheri]
MCEPFDGLPGFAEKNARIWRGNGGPRHFGRRRLYGRQISHAEEFSGNIFRENGLCRSRGDPKLAWGKAWWRLVGSDITVCFALCCFALDVESTEDLLEAKIAPNVRQLNSSPAR